MLALRGEPEVGHDRDAGAGERVDLRGEPGPALELDGVRAALLHEPDAGLQRLAGRDLVAAERQIGDDQRVRRPTDDGLHQRHQLVDGDGDGVVVAVDVVAGGVADEQDRDAGLVEDLRGVAIVGGEHRPALAPLLHLGEVVEAGALGAGRGAVGRLLGGFARSTGRRGVLGSRHRRPSSLEARVTGPRVVRGWYGEA